MNSSQIPTLKKWVEHKYATGTRIEESNKTIILDRNIITLDGVRLYTDGIRETNDEFQTINISGFNYAMVCFYGQQYKSFINRIIIYCNPNSSWDLFKYARTVRNILKTYQ
jgi:hypothetical protein